MKKLLLVFFLLVPLSAQELVTLSTPIMKPSTSSCNLDMLNLDVTRSTIVVNLVCNNGERISKQYDSFTTPTGAVLLHQLNIGNFSTNSLMKAVYNRLITDGVIVGTISGVPQ
jgi:TRAP-type mannitol/chloroaromatic compound transport system permease large subunit